MLRVLLVVACFFCPPPLLAISNAAVLGARLSLNGRLPDRTRRVPP